MQRIMIRAGRSPFDRLDAVETWSRNVIGNNNGNLVFSTATHKLLSTAGTEVVPNRYAANAEFADEVNDTCDAFVLPFANAFRPSFERTLVNHAAFIRKLKIPFALLSCGAQLPAEGGFERLKKIEKAAKAFCSAVLEKSSAITVRGEVTADYIRSLGFRDVLVIGCPSMTMNGRGHRVEVKPPSRLRRPRVAYNIQSSKDMLGALVADIEKSATASYFPQDIETLDMMLWGLDRYDEDRDPQLPLRSEHRQFTRGRAEYALDAFSWMHRMRSFDLAVGPRIHGNIVAILAGTPGLVLAHDSRTLELARYHGIPHVAPAELDGLRSLEDLYPRLDFTEFNRGHGERFDRLVGFLRENGFATIYDPDQTAARAAYEQRVAAWPNDGFVGTTWRTLSGVERGRLRYLRQRQLEDVEARRRSAVELKSARTRIARLEALLAESAGADGVAAPDRFTLEDESVGSAPASS
ncbi:polysaccharide pyruvyl transferase family protein [uncultured Friedmanniella sp.]|uniref:polysaccharide pyruvyl transferase family protein n=1 Tax=uncultured Friedmanniella sp. TaxID=335381 RepID=UPI0035CC378A